MARQDNLNSSGAPWMPGGEQIPEAIANAAAAGGSDASTTIKGITKLSVAPVSASSPIAIGANDTAVERVANKSTDIATDAASNTKYPGVKAIKDYVDDNAGDVVGPTSATDGNLAVFDGTTGKLLKDGGAPGGGGSFLSANTARVDPSGNDGTGEVGDLNKPFLTRQAAVDAFVALADTSTPFIIEIGANSSSEDLTIDDEINITFKGVGRAQGVEISNAFNSLTLTATAIIGLKDCNCGDIFTSEDLTLNLDNSATHDIASTQTGGTLVIRSLGNNSETTAINGGDVGTLTVAGCSPADTGTDTISLNAENSGTVNILNCQQQSGYNGCYDVEAPDAQVIATASLLNDVTADSIEFMDTRAAGTITSGNPVSYNDVFLKAVPSGGTTGQVLEKVDNADFATGWATP